MSQTNVDAMSDQTLAVTGNRLYPVFLKLEQMRVLLVGGGNVAEEKLLSLLGNAPDTKVTVVAPLVRPAVHALLERYPQCRLIERAFELSDLDEADLVVMTTDNPALHREIREEARARRLLVNVADTPDLCDFYLGSIVRKGDLKIAISTNGKSPTAAKRLREMLTEALPDELDAVLQNLNRIREGIRGDFSEKVRRMNEITQAMVAEEATGRRRWDRIARNISLAFIFMIIGYFFFTYLPVAAIAGSARDWYAGLDDNFHWVLLAGFIAQLIDGALGMGYGVASASILLSAGVNPAAISGSIHTAEMFASGASGISHYKFGNVNKRLFWRLVIPGVLGAIAGAIVLVYLGDQYGDWVKPFIAVYTLMLGIRFLTNALRKNPVVRKVRRYRLLAAFGGFFDSFGGGGWGPIVTTTLINGGRSHRFTVGTVSLTEFFVTFASAMTFFQLIGISHWQTILALVVGGFTAAPIAARLAGKLPRKTASLLLGLLVIIWSMRIIVRLF